MSRKITLAELDAFAYDLGVMLGRTMDTIIGEQTNKRADELEARFSRETGPAHVGEFLSGLIAGMRKP